MHKWNKLFPMIQSSYSHPETGGALSTGNIQQLLIASVLWGDERREVQRGGFKHRQRAPKEERHGGKPVRRRRHAGFLLSSSSVTERQKKATFSLKKIHCKHGRRQSNWKKIKVNMRGDQETHPAHFKTSHDGRPERDMFGTMVEKKNSQNHIVFLLRSNNQPYRLVYINIYTHGIFYNLSWLLLTTLQVTIRVSLHATATVQRQLAIQRLDSGINTTLLEQRGPGPTQQPHHVTTHNPC